MPSYPVIMASETPGIFTMGYIDDFFKFLSKGVTKGDSGTLSLLRAALKEFASSETEENASVIYRTFRNVYRLSNEVDLLGLMEMMHAYEKRADKMVDSQRDHYVHSINVFTMGLAIYASSARFKGAFYRSRKDSTFSNIHEEFLYIWGMASMFHDMGYPIEISYNKIRRFLRAACYKDDSKIAPVPLIKDIEDLRIRVGDMDTLDLISERVSDILGISLDSASHAIRGYEKNMYESCRVDHGYFSALMLVKWMSNIHGQYGKDAIAPVVEAATAILMHNFHNHTFTRQPYNLGPLSMDADPISYLLILCDELQEWNRVAYGAVVKSIYPSQSRYVMAYDAMNIEYRTVSAAMSESFPMKKKCTLHQLLRLEDLFPNGFDIVCTCERSAELFLKDFDSLDTDIPQFFVDNIESVAKEIHMDYVRRRMDEGQTEYGDWDSLRDDLRLSNIKQAYGYFDKLAAIGCIMSMDDLDSPSVDSLSDGEIEFLSILEHDRWVSERKASGWVYGEVKDSDNRISPYIAPWGAIPENIREYDREAVRNILPILNRMGIKVYRSEY